MSAAPSEVGRSRPVEKFKPTSGLITGWGGLAAAAFAIAYCLVVVHSLTGVRVALGVLLFAVVVWISQLRPRATAYAHDLVLKNTVRDTVIPLAAIEEVSVRAMLQVFAAGEKYVCVGIGRPVRQEMRRRRKSKGNTLLMGGSGLGGLAQGDQAERASSAETATSYQGFVETRIDELAREQRRDFPSREHGAVFQRWAWPEIGALVVTAVGFVVSLLA